MPALSIWRPVKSNDYRFFDRTIAGQMKAGATDILVHKFLGPANNGPSNDFTQPEYATQSPTNIQDLLFLENRDRSYDKDIYILRGHYNVQNVDFDLSQFGLFLNSDVKFIVTHYNTMIDTIGRKLMVGDVIEIPHLLDYNPLDEGVPIALKRFMQITDADFASEGFSPTWYPHLWRIKCEPLVNTQEFDSILKQPINKDNYLGDWNATMIYPPGYTMTFGNTIYQSLQNVPAGTTPPNPAYWQEITDGGLADVMSTYRKNIEINDAALQEAQRLLPLSGYDTSNLYITPSYGEFITDAEGNTIPSGKLNQPAPPGSINVTLPGYSANTTPAIGSIVLLNNPMFKNPSAGIKISEKLLTKIQGMLPHIDPMDKIGKFVQASLQTIEIPPEKTSGGSGAVSGTLMLRITSLGIIIGPYGTADNTYATADQDPTQTGFKGTITQGMDYRADCDPRFQYILRATPRSFGYTTGYMTGSGQAPNGEPTGAGISFPLKPNVGDYFLRIDYLPQALFRWDGQLWVRISESVRTNTGFADASNQSLLGGFINDPNKIKLNNTGQTISELQPISTVLQPDKPNLPPRTGL